MIRPVIDRQCEPQVPSIYSEARISGEPDGIALLASPCSSAAWAISARPAAPHDGSCGPDRFSHEKALPRPRRLSGCLRSFVAIGSAPIGPYRFIRGGCLAVSANAFRGPSNWIDPWRHGDQLVGWLQAFLVLHRIPHWRPTVL
jgi:hypothetical protein